MLMIFPFVFRMCGRASYNDMKIKVSKTYIKTPCVIKKNVWDLSKEQYTPLCCFRKHPYFLHREDWNFLGVGGSVRPKTLKNCIKFNWKFKKGGEGLRKNPFHGGGMNIFWNNTSLLRNS